MKRQIFEARRQAKTGEQIAEHLLDYIIHDLRIIEGQDELLGLF